MIWSIECYFLFWECDARRGDHCFKVYSGDHTWYEAKTLCENDGGRLPEVCSAETNDVLEQLMNDQGKWYVWSGLHVKHFY